MEKTANYQLNQWKKTDRIMMEDFNSDNAKIDAALKAEETARAAAMNTVNNRITAEKNALTSTINGLNANKLGLTFIGTFSAAAPSGGTPELAIPTPGVHYGDYVFLYLEATINDARAYFGVSNETPVVLLSSGTACFWAAPMKNGDSRVLFTWLGGNSLDNYFGRRTYAVLDHFAVSQEYSSSPIRGTATVKLWGVK